MDPNETLRLFTLAVLEENREDANEHYQNLRTWLERGGFEPSWGTGCRASRAQFFRYNPCTGFIE